MQYAVSIVPAIAVSVLLTTSLMISIGTNYHEVQGAVVRDSQTQLLDGETVSAGGFIHLHDSTPYKITALGQNDTHTTHTALGQNDTHTE